MHFTRVYGTAQALANVYNGTFLVRGTVGTNSAASPNFQDLTAGAFAKVNVGDRIYISGESAATVFLVDTKTDDNNLVLDSNIVNAHTANAKWSAHKNDAIPEADIVDTQATGPGQGTVIYTRDSWG